jgi:hypothetical protein
LNLYNAKLIDAFIFNLQCQASMIFTWDRCFHVLNNNPIRFLIFLNKTDEIAMAAPDVKKTFYQMSHIMQSCEQYINKRPYLRFFPTKITLRFFFKFSKQICMHVNVMYTLSSSNKLSIIKSYEKQK